MADITVNVGKQAADDLKSGLKDVQPEIEKAIQGLDKFKSGIQQIGALGAKVFATLSAQIAATAAIADPARFQQFTLAMRDLAGVVGQILAPVLERVTELVRGLADWIINLSDGQKALFGSVVGVGLGFSSMATILPKVISGVVSLVTAVMGLNVATGGILVAVGLLATALIPIISQGAETGSVMESLADAFRPVMDALKELGGLFTQAMKPIGELVMVLGEALRPVLDAVSSVIKTLISAMSTQIGVVTNLISPIKALIQAIAPLISVVFQVASGLAEIFGSVLEVVNMVIGAVLGLLLDALKPLVSFIVAIIVPAFQLWLSWIKVVANFLKDVIRLTKELFGIQSRAPSAAADRERRSSVGAGGRSASFISGEEVSRKAIIASVTAPGDRAIAQRDTMIQELRRLNQPRRDAFRDDQARNGG